MELLQQALAQGVTPAVIVVIYLIIIKILDSKKEKAQTKLNAELTKSINNISTFLLSITKNIIDKDKDKCKIAIEDSFKGYAMELTNFVSNTLINNHIDANKDIILSNIHNIVNSEFYTVFTTLSLYSIDNLKVSDYLDKDWISDIERDVVDIIYNNSLNKEDKILTFANKINLRFSSYTTYIINKSLK